MVNKIQRLWIFLLIVALTACNSLAAAPQPAPTAVARCGDGRCQGGENAGSCPQDCPAQDFSGKVRIVYIQSEGVGKIAVMVASPKKGRYPEGAGVVVIVSPFLTEPGGFQTNPDLTSLGLIQISYLWPGLSDERTGASSEGEFDYGGGQSIQVLRDVIRFAAGRAPDLSGRYLSALASVPPLVNEVGLYAFSDAGMAVVNLFALYGDQLPGVQYYVGRENPTVDTLACLEAGYINDDGRAVYNPFYRYPESYNPAGIALNYANLRWAPDYPDVHHGKMGLPYLDLDASGTVTEGDYLFGGRAPLLFGKRYYSTALTQALLDTGALTLENWPADLATPEEAARAWAFRQSNFERFIGMRLKNPNLDLKVMLVFAREDHLQAAPDKPHIHQAFQGFRFGAGLWVRLNPDRAYVLSLAPGAGADFPDNPVNTQPTDWTQIAAYAYPGNTPAGSRAPLAAIIEMADRAHTGRWDENFGQAFYTYSTPTPQP